MDFPTASFLPLDAMPCARSLVEIIRAEPNRTLNIARFPIADMCMPVIDRNRSLSQTCVCSGFHDPYPSPHLSNNRTRHHLNTRKPSPPRLLH